MVEPDLIDDVPTTLPLSSAALFMPFLPISRAGWVAIETRLMRTFLPPPS